MREKLPRLIALMLLACGAPDTESDRAPAHSESPAAPEARVAEPTEPASEEAEPDALLDAEDFLFEWARGSGAVFVDRVSLRGDGQLIWIRPVPGQTIMRVLETRVSDREVGEVRLALSEARYFDLAPEHVDPNISDGPQLTMRVRAGDRSHRVRCDNLFPAPVASIQTAVEALLTEERARALASAPEAQPEDFDPSLLAE